jgi:hypothetical protein
MQFTYTLSSVLMFNRSSNGHVTLFLHPRVPSRIMIRTSRVLQVTCVCQGGWSGVLCSCTDVPLYAIVLVFLRVV